MLYCSLLFIYGFLPVSLGIYYAVPKKFKDIALLLESLVFCGFFGLHLLIFMAAYTLVNYTAAQLTFRASRRKGILRVLPAAAGICLDAGALLFFREQWLFLLKGLFSVPESFFPIGISLFSLSAIGYLLDVYRGNIRAEKNFVRFALYVMMFPRLIMGPVVNYRSYLLILRKRRYNIGEIGSGMILFVKGLAKKVLFGDWLYMLYSAVKGCDFAELSAASAWLGITAYILCLYFTLSGFADMGAGISRCFGMRFPVSFSYPVFSGRIRYFASGWFIQPVHWFREYLTKPLSSQVRSKNLSKGIFVAVWALGGYWFGFSLGGAVWGALTGASILAENRLRNVRLLKSNGIFYTFFITSFFAVFLSTGSVPDGLRYMWVMTGGSGIPADALAAYLFRAYIVVILAAVYASTDLFANTIQRIRCSKCGAVVNVIMPFVMPVLLMICTSVIACTGSSDAMIVRL